MRGMIVIVHRLCPVPINSEQYSDTVYARIQVIAIASFEIQPFAKAKVLLYLMLQYIK